MAPASKGASRQRDDVLAAERSLPHNLDAERSILGGIIVNNSAYERVSSIVRPDHFYRDAHKRIYLAIHDLIERRIAVDFVTLKEELSRRGELDEIGGPAYLASLADGMPQSVNVGYYAGIVREKGILRDVCFVANRALSEAYEAETPSTDLLRKIDTALLRLQQQGDKDGLGRDLKGTVTDMMQYLEWRTSHRGENTGVTTGFACLDEMTFGWQVGDLIVVAARPSVGKTTILLNNATTAALAGKRVVIFSFEMKRRQLQFRMVSSLSGVPLTRILGGYLGDLDYPKLSAAFEQVEPMSLIIDDQAGLTVGEIRTRCRRLKGEGPLDLVAIDYVQLVPGSLDRRGATRNEEITDISRRLKTQVAEELGVPVIVLSQLKRLEGRRPTLEDLRESGALEQDADVALLLHRKKYRESGPTEVIVAKHRNGPTGTRILNVDLDTVTFTEPTPEEQEAAATTPEPEPEAPRRRRKKES